MPDGTRRNVIVQLYPKGMTWYLRDGGNLVVDKDHQMQNRTSHLLRHGENINGVLQCELGKEELKEFTGATLFVSCSDMWEQTYTFPFVFEDAAIKQGTEFTRRGLKTTAFTYGYPVDEEGRVVVKDAKVYLVELFRGRNHISGFVFERCEIIGPGVIRLGNSSKLERPLFTLSTGRSAGPSNHPRGVQPGS